MNKKWIILEHERNVGSNDIIEKIFETRSISDPEEFLFPSEKNWIDCNKLKNIDVASDLLVKHLRNNSKINVFMDVDTDGVCSGVMVYQYLQKLNANVDWCINIGKEHGLQGQPLESWVGEYDLIIVVDSSSENYKEHKFLKENGIDVIILDHHKAKYESDNAVIVNSQLDNYPNPQLSGSGVAFKFLKYMDNVLNENYADEYWDLATVGIIADMMDVSERSMENRYICYKGFLNLQNRGLKAVLGNYSFDGQAVSYSIAPLINSAMRLDQNELAVALLLAPTIKKGKEIVKILKHLKDRQNKFKKSIVDEVIFQLKNDELDKNQVISIVLNDMTEEEKNITGLIATEISREFKTPTLVLHKGEGREEGCYTGSIRSYGVPDLRTQILNTGCVKWCRGHEQAAGISIPIERYEAFLKTINQQLSDYKFEITEYADIAIKPNEVTFELLGALEKINLITGEGFKPITVVMRNVSVNGLYKFVGKHCKFSYKDIEFVIWNCGDKFDELSSRTGECTIIDCLGSLSINNFRGRNKQFIIDDYRNIRHTNNCFRFA